MKQLSLLLLALLAGCGACSTHQPPNYQHLLTKPSLQLITPYGFGHGCPVDGMIYTARHLVQPRPTITPTGVTFRGSDRQVYTAGVLALGLGMDVALLDPGSAPLTYYPPARLEPEPGAEVFWWEYAMVGRDTMRARFRSAYVLRNPAGHLVIDRPPQIGASGGCVFNEAGQVVGIIIWAIGEEKDAGLVAPIKPRDR